MSIAHRISSLNTTMKLSALLRSQLQYNACEFVYYCNMYVHVHKRYVDGHIISLFIFFSLSHEKINDHTVLCL